MQKNIVCLLITYTPFKPTSPVKAYKFYGLVHRGKYRNTFQTDRKYKVRFRARGSAEALAITQLQCETKGWKILDGSKFIKSMKREHSDLELVSVFVCVCMCRVCVRRRVCMHRCMLVLAYVCAHCQCICVCINVCVHGCTLGCARVSVFVCGVNACVCVCMCVRMRVCMHAHRYVCARVCAWIYVSMCARECNCVCVCARVCVW